MSWSSEVHITADTETAYLTTIAGTQFISDYTQPISIRIATVETAKLPTDHNTDAEAAFPAAHAPTPQTSQRASIKDTQEVFGTPTTSPHG